MWNSRLKFTLLVQFNHPREVGARSNLGSKSSKRPKSKLISEFMYRFSARRLVLSALEALCDVDDIDECRTKLLPHGCKAIPDGGRRCRLARTSDDPLAFKLA